MTSLLLSHLVTDAAVAAALCIIELVSLWTLQQVDVVWTQDAPLPSLGCGHVHGHYLGQREKRRRNRRGRGGGGT